VSRRLTRRSLEQANPELILKLGDAAQTDPRVSTTPSSDRFASTLVAFVCRFEMASTQALVNEIGADKPIAENRVHAFISVVMGMRSRRIELQSILQGALSALPSTLGHAFYGETSCLRFLHPLRPRVSPGRMCSFYC
jgi:hypothetical protein